MITLSNTAIDQQLTEAIAGDSLQPTEEVRLAGMLIAGIRQASERVQARSAVLLGILAEKQGPAGHAAPEAVREGLGTYLDLLRDAATGGPLYLALMYLLAHFPADSERILPVARGHEAADPLGVSRLERTLRQPDPADPHTVQFAGRSWPSPAFLQITEAELTATAQARATLPAEQVMASWNADTAALLAYAGALAVARGA